MRSNEVAKAADVSVRTLRHYHDMGLLPEPPRADNGYRNYSALDVARVMRIKRLASLGFSLSDIASMDDSDSQSSDATLATLDAELEQKINAMQEQRRIIAELRSEQLDPSLPTAFSKAIKHFYGKGSLAQEHELSEADKAALVLAGSLYTESDTQELERFAKEAIRTGAIDDLRAIDKKINSLSANASAKEQDALVEEALNILEPLLHTLDPGNWTEDVAKNWSLFDDLVESNQNPAQKAVNARIEDTIAKRMSKTASS